MNEPKKISEPPKISERKRLSCIKNPLKHGLYSKYICPEVVELLKNPDLIPSLIFKNLGDLEKSQLDTKEKIAYCSLLCNIHKLLMDYYKPQSNGLSITKEEYEHLIQVLTDREKLRNQIVVYKDKENNPTGNFLEIITPEPTAPAEVEDEVLL